ncbi:hypothetical protein [Roseivivax sp. CAU 1753]
MSRRFITLVLVASTAISVMSTQARATSPEDIAKILGSATLLYFISQAVDEAEAKEEKQKKKDKQKKAAAAAAKAEAEAEAQAKAHHSSGKHNWIEPHTAHPPHVAHPPHKPHKPNKAHEETRYYAHPRTVPPRCRVTVPIEDGKPRVFYSGRCLKRHYPAFATLPAACNVKFTYNDRLQSGFFERCLDRRGYYTPRH